MAGPPRKEPGARTVYLYMGKEVNYNPEGMNLIAALEAANYTTQTWADQVDWDQPTNLIALPWLRSPLELSPAAKANLTTMVAQGGKFVVAGGHSNAEFLNSVFGYSIEFSWGDWDSDAFLVPETCGDFCGGPASLPRLDMITGVANASLPNNALPVYTVGDSCWVFSVPYGAGQVLFLASDFMDSALGTGWVDVVYFAHRLTTETTTTSSTRTTTTSSTKTTTTSSTKKTITLTSTTSSVTRTATSSSTSSVTNTLTSLSSSSTSTSLSSTLSTTSSTASSTTSTSSLTSSMTSSSTSISSTSTSSTRSSSSTTRSRTMTKSSSTSTTTRSSSTSLTSISRSSSTTSSRSSTAKTSQTSSVSSTSSSSKSSTSSSTSTQTESTTTQTVTTSSTSTSSPLPTQAPTTTTVPAAQVAAALEGAVKENVKAVLGNLANSTSTAVETDEGVMTIFSMDKLLDEPGPLPLAEAEGPGGGAVALSKSLLKALPAGAVLSMVQSNEGDGSPEEALANDPFADVGGGELANPSMAITIFDENLNPVKELSEPLLFKLPGGKNAGGEPKCVYLDTSDSSNVFWSTEGVRKATPVQVEAAGFSFKEGEIWCLTDHLSIFAALAELILGCTNFELLTTEAMSAIIDHEGWWQSRPSVLFACFVGVLTFLVLLGHLRERWELRLGRTHQKGQSVKICKSFLQFGPQMLKHRYAAFVILARDVLNCIRKGKAKLRKPTLKQAIQRCFSVRTGVSNACVTQHCWNAGVWMDTQASLPNVVLCHKLEFYSGGAEEVIEHELRGRNVQHILRRYVITFLAGHPLLDALRLGASSMSILKRATMQLAGFCGIMAANAMIFNFSGDTRSWEADAECAIPPTSNFFIVVATFVSVLLNVLPNQFLTSLAKQVHGQDTWNAIFWSILLTYLLGALFIVVIALANLNAKDQGKWHKSMEWSLTIKFLVMPLIQAVRNNLLLEVFLHEDSKSNHIEVSMSLKDPYEQPLFVQDTEAVELMAKRAVSTQELVHFLALLGDKVMPDYEPETSTAEDVLNGAIRLFYQEQPCLEDTFLSVEVVEVHGLKVPQGAEATTLSCSMTHLGCQEQLHRPHVASETSDEVSTVASGTSARCSWHFCKSFSNVKFNEGFGFKIMEKNETLATAYLPIEEVLRKGGFSGELHLQLPEDSGNGERFTVHNVLRAQHTGDLSGSKGTEHSSLVLSQQARLLVKVELPPEYMQALKLHEVRNLKGRNPVDESEVHHDNLQFHSELLRQAKIDGDEERAWRFAPAHNAYCEPVHEPLKEGILPPDRLVVHSQKINFLDLVSMLLADAIAEKNCFETLRAMLKERDFHAVLDMLNRRGKGRKRYWVSMFAMGMDAQYLWHKDLLTALPTLIRTLKRECCKQAVADIHAKAHPSVALPVQLLVVDRDCFMFRDSDCLAEVQLAKTMSFCQKMVLHPEHARSLKVLPQKNELEKPQRQGRNLPWTHPYLKDRGAMTKHLVGLSSGAIKRLKEDSQDGEDLKMDDVAAVVAAQVAASRSDDFAARGSTGTGFESTRSGGDFGQSATVSSGAGEDAADADGDAADGGDIELD